MAFVHSWLILFCFLSADVFEPLEHSVVSSGNGVDCTLLNATQCAAVGACILSDEGCAPDSCYEKTLVGDCKAGCGYAKWENSANSSFCVNESRIGSFSTNASVCSLEWGEYYYPMLGLCKILGNGCGQLEELPVVGYKFYVCKPGKVPADPCSPLTEEVCPYVKECMWESGQCVTDTCWENIVEWGKFDKCRAGCGDPTSVTSARGYCKTPGKNLQSECNILTQGVTSFGTCTTFPSLPDNLNCGKVVTINKFDGSTLYVCNTEDKEFTIDGAITFNSFAVAISALVLLMILM